MIEGRGALTTVDGEPCVMDPASLVLTPQWSWHDHANETDRPVIWLEWEAGDVLAIPHWAWVRHENRSAGEPAFLFSASDPPILHAFGILREEVAATS